MKTKKDEGLFGGKILPQHFVIAVVLLATVVGVYYLFQPNNNKQAQVQLYHKSSQAAPNSTIAFSPASISVGPSQNFNLNAQINPGSNQVSAVELHVTFDPAKITLTSMSAPSSWNVLQAAGINNTAGTASIIVGVSPQSPPVYVTTTTTVASLSFTVKTLGTSSTSPVAFASTTQAAANGETGNVITTMTNATVTINAAPPTLAQVTAVPTPTNNTAPSYTFSSTAAGTITYGGDCSSSKTSATSGNNTVTFNALAVGTHSNCTIKVTDTYGNQSAALAVNSFTIDTTPPVISGTSPSGTLSVGTTAVTFSLTTNENATCKYSTTTGTSYASMTNTFSTTGATSQSTKVSGLSPGNTYNYYVRCQDTAGNADASDYSISFSIAAKIPGDLNLDGKVDIYDYNIFLTNFGNTTCGNVADIDGNCKVDIFDYNTLITNFGRTS